MLQELEQVVVTSNVKPNPGKFSRLDLVIKGLVEVKVVARLAQDPAIDFPR